MYIIVTRSFPPEVGGMQNLMWGLTCSLAKYNLVKVFADYHEKYKEHDQKVSFSIDRVGGIKLLRKHRKSYLVNEFIKKNQNISCVIADHWKSLELIKTTKKKICLIHSKEINHPIGSFINKRVENFSYLYNGFQQFNEFLLPEWDKSSKPSWFGFPLTLKENVKFNRVDLLKFYDERRIGTRLLFGGNITLQPAYQDIDLGNPEDFPIANKIVNNTFWLGVYPGLTNEMLDFVINTTKEFLDQQ